MRTIDQYYKELKWFNCFTLPEELQGKGKHKTATEVFLLEEAKRVRIKLAKKRNLGL